MVIPVYRSEKILAELCRRLSASLSSVLPDHEILLIDDGSPDDSWRVMEEMARQYPQVVAVRLSRNFGQHYAITAGLDLAQGEWVVVMDCDLQDRPEEIHRLLEKAREGYDIVLARRSVRKDGAFKRLSSCLFYGLFALLSGYRLDESVGSFRVMHRRVVQAFCRMRETYRLFGGMIEWVGFRTAYLDVDHAARFEGKSSYNLRRLLKLSLDGVVSFSNRPLYISVAMGTAISLLAGLYGVYLLFHYFFVSRFGVEGWLSSIVVNAFLGGLILLNLGIIGLYLGRIYDQTKARPLYIIDRILAGTALGGNESGQNHGSQDPTPQPTDGRK